MRAVFGTNLTAFADVLVNLRFAVVMLFHFTGPGAASHTKVFDCPAKAGELMTFKMIQGKNDIGVHDSAADPRFFNISTAFNRDENLVCPLETVRNNYMAAGGKRGVSILVSSIDMINRVFPATDI